MSQGRSFFGRWVSDPRYASAWVLALLVLALVFIYKNAPDTVTHTPSLDSPEFRVHQVELAPVTLRLESQGTARARDRLALTFRAGGEVLEVFDSMASGRWVEKGELLVRLDPEPFELEVAQRRHDVESAKLHLEQAEAKATIARRSPSSRATDFALNVPQLREARARVNMARAALNQAVSDLERATMKAPFSGRLEQVNVSVGQTVAGGESLGELFSSRRMEIRLPVRNEWLDLMAVFPGEPDKSLDIPVRLHGSFGGRDRNWDAVITRRESGVSSNQMSWLIAEVDPDSGAVPLEPRVYVEAEIQGRRLSDVATIPRSSMVTSNEVWVVDESNRLRRQEVVWTYRDDQSVYVTEGLKTGQRILEKGSDHLLEGSEIRVIGGQSPAPTQGRPTSGRIVRDV